MKKENYHQITVAEMAPHVHDFLPNENKVNKIVDWLCNWILLSLECRKIKPYDFLPSKADLACHIGVSQGTIQNAYRVLEDKGFVESKQRIGTYVKLSGKESVVKKLTSKRELAVEIVKKYLIDNSYKIGDNIASIRRLSDDIGINLTTLQMAVNNLVALGILQKKEKKFVVVSLDYEVEKIQTMTLVEKTALSLKEYIKENFKAGDRLPTNNSLVKLFKVSVKTIHDAIRLLAKEGLLRTRRGRYGTIVLGDAVEKISGEQYCYERVEQKIRCYISENCEVGEKLPSIKTFANLHKTSEKTIKKALDNLAEEGYIAFSRGRYGGTFVLDVPQASGEAYKWLAINTEYMSN